MNKKGFTLIELLVVISIIGIVTVFLVPALGKARGGARRTQCTNNLRQIGMAMSMYLDDHGFKFIPYYINYTPIRYWYDGLMPSYIDNIEVFRCPDYKYHIYGNPNYFSYGYNADTDGLPDIDINAVKVPSQCIMVADSGPNNVNGNGYSALWKSDIFAGTGRHSRGTNIVFVDGHVSWYRNSAIPTSGADGLSWWNY